MRQIDISNPKKTGDMILSGKSYDVTDEICEKIEAIIEANKPEVFYRTGQRFKSKDEKEWRLALVGDCRINLLSSGGLHCWKGNPVTISSSHKITEDEFKELGKTDTLTLI